MAGMCTNLIAGVLVGLTSVSAFSLSFTSSAEYKTKIEQAEDQYVAARKRCDLVKDHAQDICIAQARAERVKQEADAEAAESDAPEAKTKALMAYAQADLSVAKAKCEMEEGNSKDVCVKRAQVEYQQSVSIAKANQKVREAHEQALDEISKADYELALEKCEQLAGEERKACVDNVKINYKK